MKRFVGFVQKEFYHIFRDKRSLFILFGMPIAQILLFGFAITNEINNVDIAILDQANDVTSKEIINKIKLKKGMILSNEPGYYVKNKYGIRIENLIYVDQIGNSLFFQNLTYAPIDLDLVNFKMLSKKEKVYLFNYHLEIYVKLSKYLNNDEKRWLINLIR